jgi:hypothetical protein
MNTKEKKEKKNHKIHSIKEPKKTTAPENPNKNKHKIIHIYTYQIKWIILIFIFILGAISYISFGEKLFNHNNPKQIENNELNQINIIYDEYNSKDNIYNEKTTIEEEINNDIILKEDYINENIDENNEKNNIENSIKKEEVIEVKQTKIIINKINPRDSKIESIDFIIKDKEEEIIPLIKAIIFDKIQESEISFEKEYVIYMNNNEEKRIPIDYTFNDNPKERKITLQLYNEQNKKLIAETSIIFII